ncbi:protocadherin Fat 4, partial [Mytilus galloprovincialis]
SPNRDIIYEFDPNSQHQDLFTVDQNGPVYLRGSMIGKTPIQYVLTLFARDKGTSQKSSPVGTLTVNVVRNQNPPIINNLPREVNISAGQGTNLEIFRVTATDADTRSPYNTLTFDRTGEGSATTYFNVNPSNGAVFLTASVSAVPDERFYLRVRAQDGGDPKKFDSKVLTIIVNRNLQKPVMSAGQYNKRILETQAVSVELVKVLATDGDNFAPNNQLEYFISSNNAEVNKFVQVDADTGSVSLKQSIKNFTNAATVFTVSFQVSARDKAASPQTADNPQIVQLTVVRNTRPMFTNPTAYSNAIPETTPGGQIVYATTVSNTDTDAPFNQLDYSLYPDSTNLARLFFEIDSSGVVRVRTGVNLNQTAQTQFDVRVVVADRGTPSLSDVAQVTVTVEHNLNPPEFGHSRALSRRIAETTAVGTKIVTLNATDADKTPPNNVIQFVRTGSGNSNEYFFINPTSGEIILIKSVADITQSLFTLTVDARDQGLPQKVVDVTITVTVLRTTGALVFTAPSYNATINENDAVGNLVWTVKANPDPGITYAVTGLSSAPEYFSVGTTSGAVTIKKDLRQDPAGLASYLLQVVATKTDVSVQKATATVSISVNRNLADPVFLPRNQAVGAEVIKVAATDGDQDTVMYTMEDKSPHKDLFFVNSQTGSITLIAPLLNTGVNNYTFNVIASDQRASPRTATARVHLTILRDIYTPQFTFNPYNTDVTENTVAGTNFITVTATDQDLRGAIVYDVIGKGSAPAFFDVDPAQGTVSVINQALMKADNTPVYELELVAYDSVYPNNRGNSTVKITMQRNLGRPAFVGGPYSATINDLYTLGQFVLQVNANDTIDNDPVTYEIMGTAQALEYYYIEPTTGRITLKKLLTEGTQSEDRITIRACDIRTPIQCISIVATITIVRNQQTPTFTNLPAGVNLEQGHDVGSLAFTASARDNDLRAPGMLQFEKIGMYPAPSFFDVNMTTGIVTASRPLTEDALQSNPYRLELVVYDSMYPTDRATGTVTFTVNRNPSTPACDLATFQSTPPENTALGELVIDVNATDDDGDKLTYSFDAATTDATERNFLYINPENGVITLKRLFTTTTQNSFVFNVIATDTGGSTASCGVNINVIRDAAPTFIPTSYYLQIDETSPVNKQNPPLLVVTATDSDRKQPLVYGIEGDLQSPYYFAVNSSTGGIFVRNDLKKDVETRYSLKVTAYDPGSLGKTATATVTIDVVHNPHPPVLAPVSFSTTIWEYVPVSSNILNITATDSDQDPLRYVLFSDGSMESARALQYFSINPDNGLITVSKDLQTDTTKAKVYNMKVRVRDQKLDFEKDATGDVTINVNRNEQSPQFQGLPYTRTLSENSLLSTSVFTLSAIDNDIRGTMTYGIFGDISGPYFFKLANSLGVPAGRIIMQNDLKNEDATNYILRVRAWDSIYPNDFAQDIVNITVTRNENQPIFTRLQFETTINETTQVGVAVIRLNATDSDGDKLRYTVISTTTANDFFTLDPDTGIVFVQNVLTTDTVTSYTMVAQASDGKNIATVNVIINVIRDLSVPTFTQLVYPVTINENRPVNDIIVTVEASDNDRQGVIRYIVVGEYPAPSLFGVNPVNGQVSIIRSVRGDTSADIYNLTVEAYDTLRPTTSGKALVQVTVLRNPNLPEWGLPNYSADVREDAPVFSDVIKVQATDKDPDDSIRYGIANERLERALNAGPSDYFFIDDVTGQMKLAKSLLNTDIQRFFVTVQACDNGSPVRCINTTVALTVDRTGQPPIFTRNQYTQIIEENKAVGDSVIVVTANDANKLGTVVYAVVTPGSEYFSMNSSSGELTLAKSVKDDLATEYKFQVVAYDSGESIYRSTADVTIVVTRNPSPPRFSEVPYRVTLDQNSPYNFMVVNTTATDADGDIPRYSVISSVPTMSYFSYDTDTGVLYLRKLLTSPPPPASFVLTVYARDQRRVNEKTGTSTISITMDYDSQPQFNPSAYSVQMEESRPVGGFVVNTNAVDNDLKGSMVYEAIGVYPAPDYFTVESTNGTITVKRDVRNDVLNLETYTLKVVAYDSQIPDLRATADVTITINRNPNAPQFQPSSNYFVQIRENTTVGSEIVDIDAVDQDKDTLTYEIVQATSNGMDIFFIDPSTGVIVNKQPLTSDSTPVNTYNMIVQVMDGRGQASNATVQILILREAADIPPRFTDSTFNTEIRFDQAMNVNFYRVNATDPDLKKELVYELIGVYPAQNFFVVNPATGDVSLKAALSADPLALLDYTLRVQVYDSALPDVRAEQSYNVKVNRNPSSPVFLATSYSISIKENYPIGGAVISVNATDADGDVVKFSIIEDANGIAAKKYFFINAENGIIFVSDNLKKSAPTGTFSFRVRARDQGKPENYGEASVAITIDRDDNTPQFVYPPNLSSYFATIEETRTGLILSVRATDNDNEPTGSIQYEAVGDGLAIAYFGVENNGNVNVQKSLLTTTETNFLLQIKAYHSFWPDNAVFGNVNITVRRNVNSPIFTPNNNYRVQINEYYPFGQVVASVRASDNDQDTIRYTILGPPADKNYFYIQSGTGDVYLRQSPSKNPSVSQYVMTVEGSDQRSPPNTVNATLTVNIVKNSKPTFSNLPGTIQLREDTPVTQLVYQVQAEDPDLAVTSGQLTYAIVGDSSGPSFFKINSTTGVITPRVNLTSDDTELQYKLRIVVYDSEIPELTTESMLTIDMTRNLNAPDFVPPVYNFPITDQYKVAQHVGTPVTATDRDGDILVYEIVNGPHDFFYLNPVTGQLTLIKDLASTNQKTFSFQVSARDQRNPEKSDIAPVTVTVDRDEDIPSFTAQKYTANIVETEPVGNVIETVAATDNDLRGWFGGTKARAVIGFDRVCQILNQCNPPLEVLTKYLKLIDNTEKRLELAKKFKCHNVVIETLASMKDRAQLEFYGRKLQPGTIEARSAAAALNNSSIKWKN